MAKFGIAVALVHGLITVGLLYLIEVIVQAFAPDWALPFSVWWGLLMMLPGLGWSWFASSIENRF